MSDNNNNNNKDKKNKDEINEIVKNNDKNNDKNIRLNVKESDKSKENIIWSTNPLFNLKLSPLQHCKNKKNIVDISRNITDLSCNITDLSCNITDLSNNVTIPKSNNQKSIKTCDNELNMTIKEILDKMDKERKDNSNEMEDFFSKITENLDKDKTLDISGTEVVTYNKTENKKKSLDDFLLTIDKKYNTFNPSSLPSYHSRPGVRYRPRRNSIYYPAPLNINRPPPRIKKKKVNIQVEIESLDDLLTLIEEYPIKFDVEYNINMQAIHNIKEPLTELKNMIGMVRLKNAVVDQILYFIQEFHKLNFKSDQDFMHTVIYGPPGTGKTETAKIMGKIFSKVGVLKRQYFKKATRADLIAGYLGQTALKTRDVIKECLGGVLFIDEAYALGNPEKRDTFAKECIDTLCEGLSDHKDELMVIIAGYEEELKSCFFAYNQGLDSRFTWRFKTDDYTYEELFLILKKKVLDIGWKLKEKEVKAKWFQDKMDNFKFYGRDIETLLAKVKIAHGRRVFCLPKKDKTILSLRDIDKGYDMFLDNLGKKDNNITGDILSHMYV